MSDFASTVFWAAVYDRRPEDDIPFFPTKLTHYHNVAMARGWESKAVEDQINAREAELQTSAKTTLAPLELERRAKREGLLLSRIRALNALQSTRDERYRVLLERALAHLDSQLAELEPLDSNS